MTSKLFRNELIYENKFFKFRQYDDDEFHLTFFNYSLVAVPASILMLIGCWGWLLIYYKLITWPYRQRDRSTNDLNDNLKKIIKRQYKELGPLR